jgi:hypothetical protein
MTGAGDADPLELRIREALGPDAYELRGSSAVEAVRTVITGAFADAWWERCPSTGDTIACFAIWMPAGTKNYFPYHGRTGPGDPDRCPLVSVFAYTMPIVLDADELDALRAVAGQAVSELKLMIDARLASGVLALRAAPPRRQAPS